MLPQERLTASQALNHPYFDAERNHKESTASQSIHSRKQIYSSAATRKRQDDNEIGTNIDRLTKYGKIYNKRKTNYNAIAMIYQSSNQCKLYNQYQSKSVNKPQHKKITSYNQNISLEKHHNKQILLKTEAKGFYIDGGDDRLTVFGEGARKTH